MIKLFTIGHSTRAMDEFIALLREFKIETPVANSEFWNSGDTIDLSAGSFITLPAKANSEGGFACPGKIYSKSANGNLLIRRCLLKDFKTET